MAQISDSANPDNDDEASKRYAEAKEARKRAKEKARSMHARIFRKKDEHGADSKPGHCARSESFRPNFSTPIKKAKAIRQSFRVVFDSSLNGLSEEEIFAFHNSGNSSLSSLTSPTGSSGSLYVSHSNFPNRLVTQGPSKFEATELNGTNCNALKMPSRR